MRQVKRVAVIGAGTIGASWTACFLRAGLDVTVSDPAANAAEMVARTVDEAWPVLERLGLAAGASRSRWRFEADPAKAATNADFVQENAPERYEIKQPLLQKLAQAVDEDVVIASSSSGLLASRLREGCRAPGRVLIGHPFHPPHLIPLVEVVGGAGSDRTAIDAAVAFYRSVGKVPVEVRKEVPGHIANRLQAALWREAVALVDSGVASVTDVDAAITEGPGLRWGIIGPHMTAHLAGGAGGIHHFMHHLAPGAVSWWPQLGSPELTDKLTQSIIDGISDEAQGASIDELNKRRDAMLVEILAARQRTGDR